MPTIKRSLIVAAIAAVGVFASVIRAIESPGTAPGNEPGVARRSAKDPRLG